MVRDGQPRSGGAAPSQVFVCGASRTGSTLLRSVLNRSPRLAIARENWFLGHQLPRAGVRHVIRRRVGALAGDEGAARLAALLYRGDFARCDRGHWRWLRRHTREEDLLERLAAVPEPDERALFRILLEMFGDWKGGREGVAGRPPVLGEKTPSHLYHVPELLRWFPGAKVVHTFRDPRGIFASELRRRRKDPGAAVYRHLGRFRPLLTGFVLFQVSYVWLRAARLHLRYQRRYPERYQLVRFEDLVASPEPTIRAICERLGIDFDSRMLDQVVKSKGFREGAPGFDAQAASRWRELNPGWVNAWFATIARPWLARFGYTG